MVILGLGSNLQDRLDNLRQALKAIKSLPHTKVLQVSPVYISDALLPDNAPQSWNQPYLNLALRCETAFSPEGFKDALKKIEHSIGRQLQAERWAPRLIDIDILAWDDLAMDTETLTIPHKSLFDRPFALWPLADIAPFWTHAGQTAAERVERFGSRFSGDAPFHTRQIYQRIDTPQLVGIINVTPDSFSDGGNFFEAEHALLQATRLVEAGADILDIGAESTAPHAQPLEPMEEWARLEPVLTKLQAMKDSLLITPKISLDTRHAAVAAKALSLGIDWINDVSGLDDPAMQEIVAHAPVDCVVMHHLSLPEQRNHRLPRNQDAIDTVLAWGEQRLSELERKGIGRDRIIFDPGIGFGKVAEQSLAFIKQVEAFTHLGARLLIGHSRKSFFNLITPHPSQARDIETNVLSLFLATQPVDYLRLHNVEMCARSFRVQAALD